MQQDALFSEKQRFTQPWLWLILLGMNGLILVGLVQQLVFGKPFGDKPIPDIGLVFVLLLTVSFTLWFRSLRLETQIREDGVYVRFYPFHRKTMFIPRSEIAEAYVRHYKPLREYGGWGLRGLDNNQALNVSGSQGIQIVTKKGHRLLIGTKKAAAAAPVLRQLWPGPALTS